MEEPLGPLRLHSVNCIAMKPFNYYHVLFLATGIQKVQ